MRSTAAKKSADFAFKNGNPVKPTTVIVFPNCKINLGLRILRKRSDGYHDLESVFYPLPFYDALELVPSAEPALSFSCSGQAIPGNAGDNLCVKAYELLKKDFPRIRGIQLHLHKAIPSGAGLGGGSADGAFTLQLLNTYSDLQIPQQALLRYASLLGSDCPFFILNTPCLATGRGEELSAIDMYLHAYNIVLVNPGISISTREAFAGISPAVPEKPVSQVIRQPLETWKAELVNDFETTVFDRYPAIRSIKEALYDQGAIYASLTGTGSTVYGIFPKETAISLSFNNYFVKQLPG